MTKIDTKKLLSISEYAKKKGCTVQAVYQKIKYGTQPFVLVGGKKFIQDDK